MTESQVKDLEKHAKEIRKLTIDQIAFLGVGHIGGAMSIVDVLALLYYKHMNVDAKNPRKRDRDQLVLSKGHAGPALYSTLARKGFFPLEWLHTLNQGGTNLPSHCDRNKTPGIDMTTGSLGQGISAACGIAYSNRIDGVNSQVYVIVGDGELNEGQNWEAAMFAAHKKLDKIILFVDRNNMQIDGTTNDIMELGNLKAKWEAFGWFAQEVSGHDIAAMDAAVEAAKASSGRPSVIVLNTIKGKGCTFCEGQVGSHNMNVTKEQAAEAIAALGE